MKLKNRTAFITGAANGIGKNIAQKLYDKGFNIIVADIQEKLLQEVYSSFFEERILILTLDVSKSSEWEKSLAKSIEKFGKIDLLLNIAGIIEPGYIYETSLQNIDKQIDINLKGTIYGANIISKNMIVNKSGHIINISSLAGLAPIPGINIYSATKFGVRGFSLAIAQELKEFNIQVSVLCPDAVETQMLDYQKDKKEAALTFSGGKILSVEDISQEILNLIDHPKVEVWLPISRGILATLGSLFPSLAIKIKDHLMKKGLKKQEQYH
jgi:3-oxoacyl-[acyl-carrier protein] reductase